MSPTILITNSDSFREHQYLFDLSNEDALFSLHQELNFRKDSLFK